VKREGYLTDLVDYFSFQSDIQEIVDSLDNDQIAPPNEINFEMTHIPLENVQLSSSRKVMLDGAVSKRLKGYGC
jgi:hypothetical protein